MDVRNILWPLGRAIMVVAPAVAAPSYAFALQYLTVAEAQHLAFPDASAFEELPSAALLQVLNTEHFALEDFEKLRVWRAQRQDAELGYFVFDAVVGKHQLIDYCVALGPQGEVRDVQVLVYRENYGEEIKEQAWRAQFAGKGVDSPLQLGRDIKNISGATLSAKHVTEGVKKVVQFIASQVKKSATL